MEPAFAAGDIVVTQAVKGSEVKEGDIITFMVGVGLVTHRVIGEEQTTGGRLLRTKGDANSTPDANLVRESNVVSRYVYRVPKMGFVVKFANSSTGRAALVAGPLLALGVMGLVDRRKKAKAG